MMYCVQVIKICLEYIVYDPNYNYDDDEGSDDMETEDGDDEEAGFVQYKVSQQHFSVVIHLQNDIADNLVCLLELSFVHFRQANNILRQLNCRFVMHGLSL